MAADSNNIIIGAATISLGGVDLGYTQGGIIVAHEPEFIDVIADQAAGVVKKARSVERMYVRTTMLELTLENVRKTFMFPTANLTGGTSLLLGYNDVCWTDETTIVLVGSSPNCGTRTFTLNTCVAMGSKEYTMTRENPAALAVEFEVLKDSNGNFGGIVDS